MKASDLKNLTTEELRDKLVEEQNNYRSAKLTHAISPMENPLALRGQRRDIARIHTELAMREMLS
ncbi:MAG: 50S ribosomal protein L29 [Schleiferiaceae bacterium]|nr:50S ribosomal protein L29 [Schleiferiaceae bacterium]